MWAKWVPVLPGRQCSWVFKRPHAGAASSLCSVLGMFAQELSLAWGCYLGIRCPFRESSEKRLPLSTAEKHRTGGHTEAADLSGRRDQGPQRRGGRSPVREQDRPVETLGFGFQMNNEQPRSVNPMGPLLWVLVLCLLARQEGLGLLLIAYLQTEKPTPCAVLNPGVWDSGVEGGCWAVGRGTAGGQVELPMSSRGAHELGEGSPEISDREGLAWGVDRLLHASDCEVETSCSRWATGTAFHRMCCSQKPSHLKASSPPLWGFQREPHLATHGTLEAGPWWPAGVMGRNMGRGRWGRPQSQDTFRGEGDICSVLGPRRCLQMPEPSKA